MNETLKKIIVKDFERAVNAKPFIDEFCDTRLNLLYNKIETEKLSYSDFLSLQSEIKVIKGLQNELNNTILKQDTINIYKENLK